MSKLAPCDQDWRDLPIESVAVWDAVAICAYRQLRRHNAAGKPQTPPTTKR
jgi:hypothetical protein